MSKPRASREAPTLTFTVIAHTYAGPVFFAGIPTREAAEREARRAREQPSDTVWEVLPTTLADILNVMYPAVDEWDANTRDRIRYVLRRDGFLPGGKMLGLTRLYPWPPARALAGLVRLARADRLDFPELFDAIDELLRDHNLVPRPHASHTALYLGSDAAVALDAPPRYPARRPGESLPSAVERVLRVLVPSEPSEPSYAVLVPGPQGPTVVKALRSRHAAEVQASEFRGMRRAARVMPEALADILTLNDSDAEGDGFILDAIDAVLKRHGLAHGSASMAWLAQHRTAWPPAAALYEIVNVMHGGGPESYEAIEQVLQRHGFAPEPFERKRAGRASR